MMSTIVSIPYQTKKILYQYFNNTIYENNVR